MSVRTATVYLSALLTPMEREAAMAAGVAEQHANLALEGVQITYARQPSSRHDTRVHGNLSLVAAAQLLAAMDDALDW